VADGGSTDGTSPSPGQPGPRPGARRPRSLQMMLARPPRPATACCSCTPTPGFRKAFKSRCGGARSPRGGGRSLPPQDRWRRRTPQDHRTGGQLACPFPADAVRRSGPVHGQGRFWESGAFLPIPIMEDFELAGASNAAPDRAGHRQRRDFRPALAADRRLENLDNQPARHHRLLQRVAPERLAPGTGRETGDKSLPRERYSGRSSL